MGFAESVVPRLQAISLAVSIDSNVAAAKRSVKHYQTARRISHYRKNQQKQLSYYSSLPPSLVLSTTVNTAKCLLRVFLNIAIVTGKQIGRAHV